MSNAGEVENVKLVGTHKLTFGKILDPPAATRTKCGGPSFVELEDVVSVCVRVAGKIRIPGQAV